MPERYQKLSADELGKLGETCWKQIFLASGLGYVPLCDIAERGAPSLRAEGGSVVLPDFEVYGNKYTVYIDSKAKTQSVLWRNRDELRHGIDERLYDSYTQMGLLAERQTGIAVLELFDGRSGLWSGALLVQSFINLGRPAVGFNEPVKKVYWGRAAFEELGQMSPDEIENLSRGRLHRNYRTVFDKIFKKTKRCWFSEHDWINTVGRNNRTKVVCSKCGTFYGYKMKHVAAD